MLLKRTGLAAAVLLASTQFAMAADDLQINGFINVTTGVLDNEDIIDSPAAPGYDTTLGFDSQTLAGLQVSKRVNDNTSATLQLISRGSQGYETEAAWAYITYEATENTDIRFGRLRTPFFHYSDFLEVGYAYNWITPPGIVYRLDSMSSITGIDVTHRFTLGATDGSIQVYAGRFKDDFDLDGDTYEMELQSAGGAVLSLNHGDFGARASYHRAEFFINGVDNTVIDGLTTADSIGAALKSARKLDAYATLAAKAGLGNISPSGEVSKFYQASLFWDNGSTSLVGEYTGLRHDSYMLNDDDAWLVSFAQRFGSVTAHLTYAYAEDKFKSGDIGQLQRFTEAEDSSVTLGLRYDYNSSVAFKAEASYITTKTTDSRQEEVTTQVLTNIQNKTDALDDTEAAFATPLDKNTGTLYTVGMSIVF